MGPRSISVTVPVGRLDVLIWEPPGRPRATVLALHGFPETPWEWTEVAELLAREGVRLVAPAQRGYSAGARPRDVAAYAIDALGEDALAVADHVGLDRVHVLGHDWGASVAWWLAARCPDRVATVTAVSVPHLTVFSDSLISDPDQQARSAYFTLFRQVGKAEDVLLDDGARRLRAMFDDGVPADRVEQHLAVLENRAALTGALNWYRAMRRSDLPDVVVPTTYLWGEDDPALGRGAAEACGTRVTGDYRFVPLAGAGHWLPEQRPGVVAAEVLDRIVSGISSDVAPA